MIIDIVFRQF